MKEQEFDQTLSYVFETLGVFDNKRISAMNVDQLQLLAKTFGIHSHSHHHRFLSSMSKERVTSEFEQSIQFLEKSLPKQPHPFLAYPMGDYNDDIAAEAAKHFDAAFKVGDRSVEFDKFEDERYRMRIPRFNIHHHNAYEVYALINGIHRALKFFKP
jgi:hypothetical protein